MLSSACLAYSASPYLMLIFDVIPLLIKNQMLNGEFSVRDDALVSNLFIMLIEGNEPTVVSKNANNIM